MMVERDGLHVPRNLLDRHRPDSVPPRGHHHSENAVADEADASRAQARRKQAVRYGRSAAALDVTQNRHAGLEARQPLQFLCQAPRVAGVLRVEIMQFRLDAHAVLVGPGQPFPGGCLGKGRRVTLGKRALGDRDDAEVRGALGAAPDRGCDNLRIVGYLGNQDDIRPAADARPEGEPPCAMAHDLGDDDAVVAVRRAVQPVERLGGDPEGGVKADRRIREGDVVVIVLGSVMMFRPSFTSRSAFLWVPPPPMQTRAASRCRL